MWRTIKSIDGKAKTLADNEVININDTRSSSQKQLPNRFKKKFTISKLGKHMTKCETRSVEIYQEEINGYSNVIHYIHGHRCYQELP